MTTNVSITNTIGHNPVKITRRSIGTIEKPAPHIGQEDIGTLALGQTIHHVVLWDNVELVIREVGPESELPD